MARRRTTPSAHYPTPSAPPPRRSPRRGWTRWRPAVTGTATGSYTPGPPGTDRVCRSPARDPGSGSAAGEPLLGVVPRARLLDAAEVGGRPLGQRGEQWREAAAEVADLVLDPGRYLREVRTQDEPVALQLAQSLGEHLRRDRGDPPLQLDEALAAVLVECPQDRRGPAAEHEIDHRADRARVLRVYGRRLRSREDRHAVSSDSHFPVGTYYTRADSVAEVAGQGA